jgi:hypothetical protein
MEHMLPHVQKDPAQLGIPNCSKAHYEVTIGKRNSQLGILKCSKTLYKVVMLLSLYLLFLAMVELVVEPKNHYVKSLFLWSPKMCE